MIKNIIFDLGRVLVNFEPLEYLEKLEFDENMRNTLNKIIFKSKEWVEYDRGIYKIKDLAQKFINNYPNLEKEINLVLKDDWVKMLKLKEDTAEFLKELKRQGFRIYILSNLSEDAYRFISQYDFFKFIDGGVYSYELKICKPDKKIYQAILNKYNLIPEESVFIDDNLDNVEAANNLKIHGIQFVTLDEVKQKIQLLLKNNI